MTTNTYTIEGYSNSELKYIISVKFIFNFTKGHQMANFTTVSLKKYNVKHKGYHSLYILTKKVMYRLIVYHFML